MRIHTNRAKEERAMGTFIIEHTNGDMYIQSSKYSIYFILDKLLRFRLVDILLGYSIFQLKLLGQLELNSSNPPEILFEAAKIRKSQFLRALTKEYTVLQQ